MRFAKKIVASIALFATLIGMTVVFCNITVKNAEATEIKATDAPTGCTQEIAQSDGFKEFLNGAYIEDDPTATPFKATTFSSGAVISNPGNTGPNQDIINGHKITDPVDPSPIGSPGKGDSGSKNELTGEDLETMEQIYVGMISENINDAAKQQASIAGKALPKEVEFTKGAVCDGMEFATDADLKSQSSEYTTRMAGSKVEKVASFALINLNTGMSTNSIHIQYCDTGNNVAPSADASCWKNNDKVMFNGSTWGYPAGSAWGTSGLDKYGVPLGAFVRVAWHETKLGKNVKLSNTYQFGYDISETTSGDQTVKTLVSRCKYLEMDGNTMWKDKIEENPMFDVPVGMPRTITDERGTVINSFVSFDDLLNTTSFNEGSKWGKLVAGEIAMGVIIALEVLAAVVAVAVTTVVSAGTGTMPVAAGLMIAISSLSVFAIFSGLEMSARGEVSSELQEHVIASLPNRTVA